MSTRIAVTLPYYNRDKYIKDAIESVLSQEGVNLHIFAVNDGSTDKSEKLAKSVIGSKSFITHTKLPMNFGVAVARNLAASQAIALGYEYIFNMGSDDILPDGALKDMQKQLISTSTSFCTPIMQGMSTGIIYTPPEHRNFLRQYQRNALVGAILYKSSIWAEFGGYDTKTYTPFGKATWEDYDLTTRVLARGYRYCVSRNIAYYYRSHEKSATKDITRRDIHASLRLIYENKFRSWK